MLVTLCTKFIALITGWAIRRDDMIRWTNNWKYIEIFFPIYVSIVIYTELITLVGRTQPPITAPIAFFSTCVQRSFMTFLKGATTWQRQFSWIDSHQILRSKHTELYHPLNEINCKAMKRYTVMHGASGSYEIVNCVVMPKIQTAYKTWNCWQHGTQSSKWREKWRTSACS